MDQKNIDDKLEAGEAITQDELSVLLQKGEEEALKQAKEDSSTGQEEDQQKVMGIIRSPIIGYSNDGVLFQCTVHVNEETTLAIHFSMDQFCEIMDYYKLSDVSLLNNHPCWLTLTGDNQFVLTGLFVI